MPPAVMIGAMVGAAVTGLTHWASGKEPDQLTFLEPLFGAGLGAATGGLPSLLSGGASASSSLAAPGMLELPKAAVPSLGGFAGQLGETLPSLGALPSYAAPSVGMGGGSRIDDIIKIINAQKPTTGEMLKKTLIGSIPGMATGLAGSLLRPKPPSEPAPETYQGKDWTPQMLENARRKRAQRAQVLRQTYSRS